jgi:hypothetical protein
MKTGRSPGAFKRIKRAKVEWFHRAVDYGIIGILVAMSFVAMAVALERSAASEGHASNPMPTKRNWNCTLPEDST